MSADAAPRKPAAGVFLGCAIALAVGAVAIWFGGKAFMQQKRLKEYGVRVVATVTDARSLPDGQRESFDVRYAFQVPDRAGTFTLSDVNGANLWATTDGQPEWELARATGHVDVLYLPEDPRVNRLIRRNGNPVGDPGAVFIIGVMIAGAALVIAWLEART